jgi:hypothetical protein
MTIDKEAISKAPSGRVTRTPVSQRNILTVKGKDPNYVYRIVNDQDDRITQFQEGGYELVSKDTVAVGDKRASTGSAVGSVAHMSVGRGQKAYVMRIPKEFYMEDQAAKQAKVDMQEASIKEKALNGTYGKLEISRS